MECTICAKDTQTPGTCHRCGSKIRAQLVELPELQQEAGEHLTPARTGSGSASPERSIGINVSALDFSMAVELLRALHSWESQIRQDRSLTPPALV